MGLAGSSDVRAPAQASNSPQQGCSDDAKTLSLLGSTLESAEWRPQVDQVDPAYALVMETSSATSPDICQKPCEDSARPLASFDRGSATGRRPRSADARPIDLPVGTQGLDLPRLNVVQRLKIFLASAQVEALR